MDPFTHLLITRKFVSPDPAVVAAGLAADIPFYLTYPAWLIRQGRLVDAFRRNNWPAAPAWMVTLHHLFHSLPLVMLVAGIIRLVSGHWPVGAVAWGLHILIDLPTHSRRHWAPQFLWPLSTVTVDGISWPDLVIPALDKIFDWLTGGDR